MSATQQAIDLLQKRVEKEEELNEIDVQLAELGIVFKDKQPVVTVGTKPSETPKPGRKPRQAVATVNGVPVVKRGRGRPSKAELGVDKQPPLEELLLELVGKAKHGLSLAEMVEAAISAGYKSTSKNFLNMVQQAVGRMIKKQVIVRDNDSMRYFKKEAA